MVRIAPTEHDVQRSICELLRYRRFIVLRLNSGGLRDSRDHVVKFLDVGDPTVAVADLLAIPPADAGYSWPALWIECKRPGWKPSQNPRSAEYQRWERQQRFLDEMRQRGHGAMVASSVEEVIRVIGEGR